MQKQLCLLQQPQVTVGPYHQVKSQAAEEQVPESEAACTDTRVASEAMSLGRREGLVGGRPCCIARCRRKSVSQLKHLHKTQQVP